MRLRIDIDENTKTDFFGRYAQCPSKFKFSDEEKSFIHFLSIESTGISSFSFTEQQESEIADGVKLTLNWFRNPTKNKTINAPIESQHLLSEMFTAAKNNALRPKNGYRYSTSLKRYATYNRMLSGKKGYNSLQFNLPGCFPSIGTTNRLISTTNNPITEGVLRVNELKLYLENKKQPLWVALSEDGTRIENRIQYDRHTNQLIGFVLPLDDHTGMPIPFKYKATNLRQMLKHLNDGTMGHSMNTIMAKPLGNAQPFCLLIFCTNNRYRAIDVSNRWKFIADELKKEGIRVLTTSSDSDLKYNSAMRRNSALGTNSDELPLGELFKCGPKSSPPYYTQDFPHIGTKLRNLFLRTNNKPGKLPFGKYFIQHSHVQQIFEMHGKDVHFLTQSDIFPVDKQNFGSVMKLCDSKVINLLKQNVKGSEGTVMFLQIMFDAIIAFMDKNLSPIKRLELLWHGLFIVRIWRKYIECQPDLTVKNNFMSIYSYVCIELNAHTMVNVLIYLKEHNLTHLFHPYMLSSQPCEEFYRYFRSLSTTCSTVTNCSMKEAMSRINRIQLMDEISSDHGAGFIYSKSSKSFNFTDSKFNENEFPDTNQICEIILKCKERALNEAVDLGLIKKNSKTNDSSCVCQIRPYITKRINQSESEMEESLLENEHSDESDEFYDYDDDDYRPPENPEIADLCAKLATTSLKNFAHRFEDTVVEETSPYAEVVGGKKRIVVKKTSVCWLFRKSSYKLSSDRRYRVMASSNVNNKPTKTKTTKKKRVHIYKR